jgi:tetratricopeptide (TPR) repeat protein
MVLSRINPLLQKKAYPRAIEHLRAFQAKGGVASAVGTAAPKGYHHPEIYYVLGNCHLLQEQFEAAAVAYRQAVARDRAHTYAWLNLAQAVYEMKDYAQAGRCFKQAYTSALKKNPQHLYFAATAYLMAKDHLQSVALFDQLLSIHPQAVRPQWKEHLVHALLEADQPRRALPFIRELARIHTGDKQIQWQEILLYQYLMLKMDNRALYLARTLTEQAPTTAKWWKALAHIQLSAGRNDNALTALTIYAFLTPLSLKEKKLLADLSLQVGIPIKAAPVYETCLKEKPNKEFLEKLIITYQQLGQSDTALRRLEDFGLKSDDEKLLMLKAELLYALRKFDQAAAAFRRVGKIDGPYAGRAWLMAGYAAWRMQDSPASKADFTRAAKHKEEKRSALTALRQIQPATIK